MATNPRTLHRVIAPMWDVAGKILAAGNPHGTAILTALSRLERIHKRRRRAWAHEHAPP